MHRDSLRSHTTHTHTHRYFKLPLGTPESSDTRGGQEFGVLVLFWGVGGCESQGRTGPQVREQEILAVMEIRELGTSVLP